MEKWVISAKRADFNGIARRFGIDPVTARLMRNRDIIGEREIEEYLHGDLSYLHSPHLLKDLDKAVEILKNKIAENKKIRVIGDYDIDGVMASYILLSGLKKCHAQVDYDLPDRIRDGYGLNQNLINLAKESKIDTILTCDNGISAMEQIEYAKEIGMTVIVTDHHELRFVEENGKKKEQIPNADAVINPHQLNCPYPYKGICGAVVAYKLIVALYESMGIPESEKDALIEYAGFATVGDVMDLTGENRILVREALRQINHTANLGMRALIEANSLQDKEICAYHIGFVLGPCLNAGGRLDTAKKSLQLLLADSETEARVLAEELVRLNALRKEMTLQGYEQAIEMIEDGPLKEDRVLVVYLPTCHESLAGIIAGRLRERYYRPSIVLTDGEQNVKGSGRSIEAYSMFEELQKCAELFLNFGGHPMAAGCSLKKENVEILRRRLNECCSLTEEELTEKIVIDVPMPIDYVSERLIEELEYLEPFGKGNTKPVFAEKTIELLGARELGQMGRAIRFQITNASGKEMEAVYFGDVPLLKERLEHRFGKIQVEKLFQNRGENMQIAAIYYPTIHEWNGRRQIQIVLQNFAL